MAMGLKGTGRGPFESATVRIDRSGKVSVFTGAVAIGQGLKTALAQICAEQLGVDPGAITVVAGDTAAISLGLGAFASRQTVMAGSAVHVAAVAVREKTLKVAAEMLEVGTDDLELRDGRVEVKGVRDLGLSFQELGLTMAGVPGYKLPGDSTPGLEHSHNFLNTSLTYAGRVAGRGARGRSPRPGTSSCTRSSSPTTAVASSIRSPCAARSSEASSIRWATRCSSGWAMTSRRSR